MNVALAFDLFYIRYRPDHVGCISQQHERKWCNRASIDRQRCTSQTTLRNLLLECCPASFVASYVLRSVQNDVVFVFMLRFGRSLM